MKLNFGIAGFPDLIAAITHRNHRPFVLTDIRFVELQGLFQGPRCYREPFWKIWPQGMCPRCFTPVKDGSATTFKLTTFWQWNRNKGKHFVPMGFFFVAMQLLS